MPNLYPIIQSSIYLLLFFSHTRHLQIEQKTVSLKHLVLNTILTHGS